MNILAIFGFPASGQNEECFLFFLPVISWLIIKKEKETQKKRSFPALGLMRNARLGPAQKRD